MPAFIIHCDREAGLCNTKEKLENAGWLHTLDIERYEAHLQLFMFLKKKKNRNILTICFIKCHLLSVLHIIIEIFQHLWNHYSIMLTSKWEVLHVTVDTLWV